VLAVSIAASIVASLAGCAPPTGRVGAGPLPSPALGVLVQPGAGPGAVLALLAAARRALWMEMYLLTDDAAVDALVGRAQAGCDVRVLLEPHPFQADGANDAAYQRLAAAGVIVRWANPRFALTHAKVAVVDHQRLVVMTLNLTGAGLGGNREYVAVDDDRADVTAAEQIVAADLAGADTPATGGRVAASPGGTRPAVEAVMAGARATLDVEMEELSDVQMVDALAGARARGAAVSAVLPAAGRSAATDAAARRLAGAGVTVRFLDTPGIHAKALVADRRLVVLGSANLTTASLDANREVGLMVADAAAAGLVAETIAGDVARGAPP
jgi:phosphatidylserine/phosphatidylglycerophosphate/cardiolipin synthase-like enzyme